jgi:hypothetical protein
VRLAVPYSNANIGVQKVCPTHMEGNEKNVPDASGWGQGSECRQAHLKHLGGVVFSFIECVACHHFLQAKVGELEAVAQVWNSDRMRAGDQVVLAEGSSKAAAAARAREYLPGAVSKAAWKFSGTGGGCLHEGLDGTHRHLDMLSGVYGVLLSGS